MFKFLETYSFTIHEFPVLTLSLNDPENEDFENRMELELSLNVIIPPPAHCHRAGFGHRMENGLVRVAPDKIVSMDRWTDGHENCL